MLSTTSVISGGLRRRLALLLVLVAVTSVLIFTGTPPASAHKVCTNTYHNHLLTTWYVNDQQFVPPRWIDYEWYKNVGPFIYFNEGWIRCPL